MGRRSAAAWTLVVGLPLLASGRAAAFHSVFDYGVTRFEADGNAFGPSDGVADFVDEFDGESLSGAWTGSVGTARVADGMLRLTSPGAHYQAGGATYDVSEVSGTTTLVDGGGDFVVTSTWQRPPADGDFIHMELLLSSAAPDGFEYVGVLLFWGGGLVISQHRGTGFGQPQIDSTPIGAPVTGAILLRLSFDDASNLLTTGYSVDGGTTFESPFAPLAIFDGTSEGVVLLGADPQAAPEAGCCADGCTTLVDADADGICDGLDDCKALANPQQEDGDGDGVGDACDPCSATAGERWTVTHLALDLRHLGNEREGDESLDLRAILSLPSGAEAFDPATSGLRLELHGAAAPPVVLAVPDGLRDESGTGWKATRDGTRFVYKHGDPAGIRKAIVQRRPDGTLRIRARGPHGPFEPGSAAALPLDVVLGMGGGASACGEIRLERRACPGRSPHRLVCE